MHIEIDTGSRLDQSGPTIFAFSNHRQKALRLSQTTRDACLAALLGNRLQRELRLFAACVYLLIKDHLREIREIEIDQEYPSHHQVIRLLLLNLLKDHTKNPAERYQITFGNIGKKSRAHEVALETYRKDRRADGTLTKKDVLEVLFK